MVKEFGPKKWALISRVLNEKYSKPNKTGKQCRERWNNNLNPKISKSSWTAHEEKILFEKHKIYGNKWSEICKFLKGRTDNSTKNHFYSIIRKNLRKFNKSQPESKKIHGNMQDLLLDSEISKILLKKPRHYHKKLSKTVTEKKVSTKSPISVEKKVIKSVKPKAPEPIYFPKPVSEVNNFEVFQPAFIFPPEIKLEDVYQGILDSSMTNDQSTCRSTIENIFKFPDIKESHFNHEYFHHRSYSRESSYKSLGYDNDTIRGDSRKNSEKQLNGGFSMNPVNDYEEIRSDSRKNSEKLLTNGFSLFVNDSRKNFQAANEVTENFRLNPIFAFPPFSPKKHFDYYSTPKNKSTKYSNHNN